MEKLLQFAVVCAAFSLCVGCRSSDSSWSGWVSWSGCTKSCGGDGTMFRTRQRIESGTCNTENEIVGCQRRCFNGGDLIGNQCYCPGIYGRECCDYDCNSIPDCEDVQCTTSSNQYCIKCDYDRGDGLGRKAYEAVYQNGIFNRICEKRCSWRPDSEFCYPGTCPGLPSTCTCAEGFSGVNCLTITAKPSINECTGTFIGQEAGDTPCQIDCSNGENQYCSTKADGAVVDWVTSFVPPLDRIETPAYVNETIFGIVQALLEWRLYRVVGGSRQTIDFGSEDCLTYQSSILNIPYDEAPSRSCRHTKSINEAVKHNDYVEITLKARNSGSITINNFDFEGYSYQESPKEYYKSLQTLRTSVYFDFLAPSHCSKTIGCSGPLLDIGDSYRRSDNIVTVRWINGDWEDSPGGVSHYKCESYKLTVRPNGKLGMDSQQPQQVIDNIQTYTSSVQMQLSERGVYAIVLSVLDNAGNVAKVRRFLVFDNQNSIETDDTQPITAQEAAFNVGVNWLAVNQGGITVTWDGHFTNSYYSEGNLLNEIEAMTPPLDDVYDEETGQPPSSRSREAIPNAGGLTKFEIGQIQSSTRASRSTQPTIWTEVLAPATEADITIDAEHGDKLTIWLRAYDIMGNVQEDTADFYVDTTPPVVVSVTMQDGQGKNVSMESEVMDFTYNQVMIQTFDVESGIYQIRWQLIDVVTRTHVFAEGHLNETIKSQTDCNPTTCHCVYDLAPANCFLLNYLITTETSDYMSLPPGDVECVVKLIVVNNARMETMIDDMTVMVRTPRSGSRTSTGGSSSGGIAGGVVVAVILLVAVVILLCVLWQKGKLPSCRGSPPAPVRKHWDVGSAGVVGLDNHVEQGYPNKGYEYAPAPGGKAKVTSPPPRPPKTNDYSASGKAVAIPKGNVLNDATLTVEEMEFPSSQLELVELVQSGIYKAKATNIGGNFGVALVIVKTMKDKNNTLQKDFLMHELDNMLTIMPHDNVIRVLGCMVQSGSPRPSIIMEYAPYNNLCEVLRRSRRLTTDDGPPEQPDHSVYSNLYQGSDSLTSNQLMKFTEQIARGMEHLADMHIIHRKLGARNIFVGENEVCKIGSFAMSIRTAETEVQDEREGRLPIRWMAVESLKHGIFSTKSDVWAYGIVVWEIVTLGALPYPNMENKEISQSVQQGYRMEKPPHCTQELYTIMLRCWDRNIHDRPTFSEILQDIQGINKNEEVVKLSQYDSQLYGDIHDL